ncbi:helix-turn-helix domain-containing protein [Citrobacter sp. Ct235]|uniref:helix-turn-helix domain-containing protein n=1 Tax=Citrobacter TaxID=544 RepID=UPI00126D6002|nr:MULTISPECIES: helix-turn-helix transcriptional regulator [Citrobacter]ECE8816105.1 XRE family transcriptional regulator [Salmonella enterica subsp. enterica serovar Reading]ELZ8150807.1 helix-turn-helix transcriptional regulator [Salmonella enterica]EEL6673128.1 helix-turn-helix transcriptional regulator [Salmonella enterica subsp. enterica serovar Reading]EKV5432381.1 helix-turn-helix transcriptional regulator [Citrobacter freundii]EKY0669475.1 helix-turn-helix transcriptional regulator [C
MKLSEKVKALREAEGLSQAKFCQIIDLSLSTLKKYETGNFEPSGTALLKITTNPQFQKYTLWLMTDKTAPQAGQIAPAIAHIGPDATKSHQSEKQTG